MLCQVWPAAHGRAAYIAYTRLFRFLLVIVFEMLFVVRFSVVVSVVLLSPLRLCGLLDWWNCFIAFFRWRCFAVSQFCVWKTVPNKVKGFIRHRDFNSTTYKVTRHTANIVVEVFSSSIGTVYISLRFPNTYPKTVSTSNFLGSSSLPFQLPTGWHIFRYTQFSIPKSKPKCLAFKTVRLELCPKSSRKRSLFFPKSVADFHQIGGWLSQNRWRIFPKSVAFS